MPRQAKPPRLYLRERDGRAAQWVILDGGREYGTGCGADDRGGAEKALAAHLATKHRPSLKGDPLIADVLALYGIEHAPTTAAPALIGYHIAHLVQWWGSRRVSEITPARCRAYVEARPVKAGTARRELETLQSAINFAWREGKLTAPVPIWLPEKSIARERWLTRSEAARLLAGALGWTRQGERWRRVSPPAYHVARFILIALYTGTRHDAILKLRWARNPDGGWFDLGTGILHRRGEGQRESAKRRPPVPISADLLPHVRRWATRPGSPGPVSYAGRLILKERRGFARARELAGLGADVTPHVLRHTCATWLLQRGVEVWEVAGYLGTSEDMIRRTYGHFATNHLRRAAATFRERKTA
jgi:integrase